MCVVVRVLVQSDGRCLLLLAERRTGGMEVIGLSGDSRTASTLSLCHSTRLYRTLDPRHVCASMPTSNITGGPSTFATAVPPPASSKDKKVTPLCLGVPEKLCRRVVVAR